jgi:hypothetical protein
MTSGCFVKFQFDASGTLGPKNTWYYLGAVTADGGVYNTTTAFNGYYQSGTVASQIASLNGSLAIFAGTSNQISTTTSGTSPITYTIGLANPLILPGPATIPGNTVTPAAGNVGELIESYVPFASKISLTSGTTAAPVSITLTAGVWDVTGSISITASSTATIAQLLCEIAPYNTTPAFDSSPQYYTQYIWPTGTVLFGSVSKFIAPVQGRPITVTTSTQYSLLTQCSFAVSGVSAYGYLCARRVI